MNLYHATASVCSVKVRVGLAEMGLDYTDTLLDLGKGDQFDPDYLALNPNGVVPTLVDGDLVLGESSLILEYLDREYNDGRLMPEGRAGEVLARHWLLKCISIHDAINSLTFSTGPRDGILANNTPEQIAASIAKMPDLVKAMKRRDLLDNGLDSVHVSQALNILRGAFTHMDIALAQHEWVSGPGFGITDIALVAYIDRIERLGFGGMLAEPWPRVADWLAKMQARPSYAAEVSGKIDPAMAENLRAKCAGHWPEVKRRWLAPAA